MRLSVERIRWGLAAAVVVMLLALVASIGYGRYKAIMAYRKIIKKAGITLSRDSHGVTFSQSLEGKKTFTVRAARETEIGKDKFALHDAELLLYTRSQEHPDRIYGKEFEYDQKAGLARALGEVEMDMQAPETIKGRGEKSAVTPQMIHLKTSGLVYVRSLGVAATDEPVEVRYLGLTCTARGAEFNTGQSSVHLLADVVADGVLHGAPVRLTAGRADLDRGNNVASFMRPVVTQGRRSGAAATAVLHLRPDGSVEHLRSEGGVELRDGTREVRAMDLDADLSEENLPRAAKLLGGVALQDTSAMRPVHGSAQTVEMSFDAEGSPVSVTAHGGNSVARVTLTDKSHGGALGRELQGGTVVARFAQEAVAGAKKRAVLREMEVRGAAVARGESVKAKTRLDADAMRVSFVGGNEVKPQHLTASGHTALEQDVANGAIQKSNGDDLLMEFEAGEGRATEIASAVQSGHVVVESRAVAKPGEAAGAVTNATAGRADYDGASDRLVLTQAARLTQAKTMLMADRVMLDGKTQDAEASGHVQGAMAGSGPGMDAAKTTHVLAASAKLTHSTGVAEFRGTDAQPAKMWQQASQVDAAVLTFDDKRKVFAARPVAGGVVHAVLSAGGPANAKAATAAVRVSASKLDYNDVTREAVFSGNVLMLANGGQAHSQRAVALLTKGAGSAVASPGVSQFSGSLDRVVLSGDVAVQQPGRSGTGEQLLYTAATGEYVLTGTAQKLPRMEDAQQGSVTGATLVFRDAGSTIVVAGGARGRVHTETEVKQ